MSFSLGPFIHNMCFSYKSKTKLKIYYLIYNTNGLPENSYSLKCQNQNQQKFLSRYIMWLHDLESEKGRWNRTSKGARHCRQCDNDVEETLKHFIFDCRRFNQVRASYPDFPTSLQDFFNWEYGNFILTTLHVQRRYTSKSVWTTKQIVM